MVFGSGPMPSLTVQPANGKSFSPAEMHSHSNSPHMSDDSLQRMITCNKQLLPPSQRASEIWS